MKLDHIGIAVDDLKAAESLIARLLGRPSYKTETVEDQQVTTTFFHSGDAGGSKLELVSPAGPDSTLHKYLAKRGPGIHHLAFEVTNIRREMKRLAEDGFQLLQTEPSRGADNKLVCFLHPGSTNGVLVEICQSQAPAAPTSQPADPSGRDAEYWSARYKSDNTGWDIGYASPPIAAYLDQLKDKSIPILIPGAGNGYEAEYVWRAGFTNVHVLDLSPEPLAAFQVRVPDFPAAQLIHGDFFIHQGNYDLILEHTFFCSFPPSEANRHAYVEQMHKLLNPGGKLVGLLFDVPLVKGSGERPFGGDEQTYRRLFEPYFEIMTMETAHNSIKPRAGRELFVIFKKRA